MSLTPDQRKLLDEANAYLFTVTGEPSQAYQAYADTQLAYLEALDNYEASAATEKNGGSSIPPERVAALHVAIADNVRTQGKQTRLRTVALVDTGALTATSSASSAMNKMAQDIAKQNSAGVPHRHWIISVNVDGFGDSNTDNDGDRKRRPEDPVSDAPSSALQPARRLHPGFVRCALQASRRFA